MKIIEKRLEHHILLSESDLIHVLTGPSHLGYFYALDHFKALSLSCQGNSFISLLKREGPVTKASCPDTSLSSPIPQQAAEAVCWPGSSFPNWQNCSRARNERNLPGLEDGLGCFAGFRFETFLLNWEQPFPAPGVLPWLSVQKSYRC